MVIFNSYVKLPEGKSMQIIPNLVYYVRGEIAVAGRKLG